MKISRREFLVVTGLTLGAGMAGCGRRSALRTEKLEHWNARTGATEATLDLQLLGGDWAPVNSSIQGFLLSNGAGILALNFRGQTQIYEGAQEACWVEPGVLITAEKASSDLYRVEAQEFPSGRPRWSHDFGYGSLIGCNAQNVYVTHPQGVSCLDLQRGREVWCNPDLTDIKCAFLGPQSLLLGLGNLGEFCRVDLQTGRQLSRQFTTKEPNRVILLVSDEKTTLAFTRRFAVAGFRTDRRAPVWSLPLTEEAHRTALLGFADSVALIELDGSSVALDLTSGKKLWSDVFCPHLSICDQVALVRRASGLGSGRAMLELQGRDLHTGRTIWKRQVADLKAITAVDGHRFAVLAP